MRKADCSESYLNDVVLSTSARAEKGDREEILTEIAMVHERRNPHREIDERVDK